MYLTRKLSSISLSLYLLFVLTACSTFPSTSNATNGNSQTKVAEPVAPPDYMSRLPSHIDTTEKVIVVDPVKHVWGAYDASGNLIKAGLATAGAKWCPDIKRACKTKPGSFRIASLGSAKCKSSIYPLPRGGAPMPYCMFFNKHQGLHGSYQVVEGNLSHGCVRLQVKDAEWIRFNFANIGTKVVVKPY